MNASREDNNEIPKGPFICQDTLVLQIQKLNVSSKGNISTASSQSVQQLHNENGQQLHNENGQQLHNENRQQLYNCNRPNMSSLNPFYLQHHMTTQCGLTLQKCMVYRKNTVRNTNLFCQQFIQKDQKCTSQEKRFPTQETPTSIPEKNIFS